MKAFLKPIVAKKGPSGDQVDFRNLKYKITPNILKIYLGPTFLLLCKNERQFGSFILDLVHIAQNPTDETYVRSMLFRLANHLFLHDPFNLLITK